MELTALQAVKMLEHVRRLLSDSLNQKRENIKREATYKCDTCAACFYYPVGRVQVEIRRLTPVTLKGDFTVSNS